MTPRERIAADHPGHVIGYSAAHDRKACIICDVWVEAQCRCGGDRCEEYPDAPERPSMTTLEPLMPAGDDGSDEPTVFAYTPDDRMCGTILLDEQPWARFCGVAGLAIDGSPREDVAP
jgi:hypothetical protein